MAYTVSKPSEDGFVSTLINRRLSNLISQRLVKTRVTPNAITISSFLMCLVAAFLFSRGQYLLTLLAGLMIQFASIIDGCDGEIARLRSKANPFGAYLDTMLDRYAEVALVAGITYTYWVGHAHPGVWALGLVAVAGFILPSYIRKEYRLRYNERPPADVFRRISQRDLRLFGIMTGALVNRPYEAMVVMGVLSHLYVGWSFIMAYGRTR